MEALAAFGIACNVIQVISFSHEVLSTCKRVLRDGSPQLDLEKNSFQLQQLSSKLLDSINVAQSPGTLSREQFDLREVASNLNESTTQMIRLLEKLKIEGAPSRSKAIKSMVNYKFRYKPKIEELEKAMDKYQKTLDSGILANLCSTNKANAVLSCQDFSKLDGNLQHFVQQYTEGNRRISDLISTEANSTRDHVTAESVETRRQLAANLQSLNFNHTTDDLHNRFLNSLKFAEMNARRSAVTVSNTKTFGWIFDDTILRPWNSFIQWLSSDDTRMYWISGKPGSGKSTLMKFIIEHDSTKQALSKIYPGVMIVSFFFWNSGTLMQRSIGAMLSSLLYQMLSEDKRLIPQLLEEDEMLRRKDTPFDWSKEDLQRVLSKVLAIRSYPSCLFIDGLDEVDSNEGQLELIQLLETLRGQPNVKLCVSSRPEPVLQESLQVYPKLRLQDLTNEDIRHMVEDYLSPLEGRLPDSTSTDRKSKDDLIDMILRKADGVFLWATLVTKSLCRGLLYGDDWKKLTERVDILPGDMNSLYTQMWSRLNDDQPLYRAQAAEYFTFCLHASQMKYFGDRVSLHEVMVATERHLNNHVIQEDADKLVKLCQSVTRRISVRCAGLLEMTWDKEDENPTLPLDKLASKTAELDWMALNKHPAKVWVTFIHRSARDFLQDTESGKRILSFYLKSTEEKHADVVRALIARSMLFSSITSDLYIKSLKDRDNRDNREMYLSEYIMLNIARHESYLGEQTQFKLLHIYRRCFESPGCVDSPVKYLELIALFGFYNFFRQLIQRTDLPYHTIATENKTQLLQSAATWEVGYSTVPGSWIERFLYLNGKLQVISHFLEAGGDPNRRFVNKGLYYYSPLSWTLQHLFVYDTIYSYGGDGRLSGQQVENVLRSFLESSADLRTTTLLEYRTSNENRLLVDSMWELLSKGLCIVVQVNCAWLIRALADRFTLCEDDEQALIPRDVEIEPESRIVQIFRNDGDERLKELALANFLDEHSSRLSAARYCPTFDRRMHFRPDEMEQYESKMLDILSKAKSLESSDEWEKESVGDWLIRKRYKAARGSRMS